MASVLNDTLIILTGPHEYSTQMIECYNDYKNQVIFSSNSSDKKNDNIVTESDFVLLKNRVPKESGKYNINNQTINVLAGAEYAKRYGYKYCLKLRSDILIYNLQSLFSTIDPESFYFSSVHSHNNRSYFCDHMLFGLTDHMINLWSLIPESRSSLPPEVQMTKAFKESAIESRVKFLFPIIYENKIDTWWIKYKKNFIDFQKDEKFSYDPRKVLTM